MMTLLLDVGNTQIYAGLFNSEKKMVLSFRRNSKNGASSDETGLFLRAAIRENGFDPSEVKQIALCSVVPDVIYSLKGACQKYFGVQPFILQAGVKTGLKIKYRNPLEVGADRIANSISATNLFPQQNIIVVDLGTATTFCAISSDKDYLGGSIVAGLRLCMEALESKTSKLPSVEIQSMTDPLGKSTVESIQSGLYYGHLGTMRELIQQMTRQVFNGQKPKVIGTGGFAHLFEKEKIFDVIIPDLVLQGLWEALKLNEGKQ